MADTPTELRISNGSADDLPALRDLWVQMLHHHESVVSSGAGVLDEETSWRATLARYRKWYDKD